MKNQKYIIEVSEKYEAYIDLISTDLQDFAKEFSEKILALSDDLVDLYGELGVNDDVVINLSALKETRILFDVLASCNISKYEEKEPESNEISYGREKEKTESR